MELKTFIIFAFFAQVYAVYDIFIISQMSQTITQPRWVWVREEIISFILVSPEFSPIFKILQQQRTIDQMVQLIPEYNKQDFTGNNVAIAFFAQNVSFSLNVEVLSSVNETIAILGAVPFTAGLAYLEPFDIVTLY